MFRDKLVALTEEARRAQDKRDQETSKKEADEILLACEARAKEGMHFLVKHIYNPYTIKLLENEGLTVGQDRFSSEKYIQW